MSGVDKTEERRGMESAFLENGPNWMTLTTDNILQDLWWFGKSTGGDRKRAEKIIRLRHEEGEKAEEEGEEEELLLLLALDSNPLIFHLDYPPPPSFCPLILLSPPPSFCPLFLLSPPSSFCPLILLPPPPSFCPLRLLPLLPYFCPLTLLPPPPSLPPYTPFLQDDLTCNPPVRTAQMYVPYDLAALHSFSCLLRDPIPLETIYCPC